MKTCNKCKQTKPITAFTSNPDKINQRSHCLACRAEHERNKRSSNPELYRRQHNSWNKRNPDRAKNSMLKKSFNITLADYKIMFHAQNGVCAICSLPEVVTNKSTLKSLAVDHNKITGVIRQLLCQKCNQALGLLYENTSNLKRMIDYINRHNTTKGDSNVQVF